MATSGEVSAEAERVMADDATTAPARIRNLLRSTDFPPVPYGLLVAAGILYYTLPQAILL
jgi:hypothetical protein